METIEEHAPPEEHQPVEPDPFSAFELGAWVGKVQAFGLIGNRCSASEAESLKRIRETRSYENLGLTWEEFCTRHAAISRSYADKLIRRLDEFGADYFRLAAIAGLSAESYRLLAPAVTEQGVEIDGALVAITPENAPRIRQAVEAIRKDLRRARQSPPVSISELQMRLDSCFRDASALASFHSDLETVSALRGLIAYSVDKLKRLSGSIEPRPH
jgi:hypothetical protein